MKKLIAIILTLVLVLSLTVPASAATTMRWDWGKARDSIGKAVSGMVQETEPAESTGPVATEYDAAEENTETEKPEAMPESWYSWLRRWGLSPWNWGEGSGSWWPGMEGWK